MTRDSIAFCLPQARKMYWALVIRLLEKMLSVLFA
jgi:hypothetical protein